MGYSVENVKILLYKNINLTLSLFILPYIDINSHFTLLIALKFGQLISKIASIYFLYLTGHVENVRPFRILADIVAKNLEQA